MNKYWYLKSEVRDLCIKNNYFTRGDNEQYERMFTMIHDNEPIDHIARVIWICSDNFNYLDILGDLDNIYIKWNMIERGAEFEEINGRPITW